MIGGMNQTIKYTYQGVDPAGAHVAGVVAVDDLDAWMHHHYATGWQRLAVRTMGGRCIIACITPSSVDGVRTWWVSV